MSGRCRQQPSAQSHYVCRAFSGPMTAYRQNPTSALRRGDVYAVIGSMPNKSRPTPSSARQKSRHRADDGMPTKCRPNTTLTTRRRPIFPPKYDIAPITLTCLDIGLMLLCRHQADVVVFLDLDLDTIHAKEKVHKNFLVQVLVNAVR